MKIPKSKCPSGHSLYAASKAKPLRVQARHVFLAKIARISLEIAQAQAHMCFGQNWPHFSHCFGNCCCTKTRFLDVQANVRCQMSNR